MEKQYISAASLLDDAFELALRVADSGFRPDLIAGIWRGGSPVGIVIHEALAFMGHDCDHIAIRTASYTGIGERSQVSVHGMDYIGRTLDGNQSLLIVDDVFDTGLSMAAVIGELEQLYRGSPPRFRIATPYFKPGNNQSEREPDYYLHETGQWLVFPHEVLGLSDEEILAHKPDMAPVKKRLLAMRGKAASS